MVAGLIENVLRVVRETAVEEIKATKGREKLAAAHEAKRQRPKSDTRTETFRPDEPLA